MNDTFENISGDGGSLSVLKGAPTLAELKTEVEEIVRDMDNGLAMANVDAQATRRCEWPGQSPNARKHEAVDGAVPEPFEGATDGRYRLADMVTNEDVMLCVLATMRAQVQFIGREPGDNSRAANMTLVLRYCLDRMGWEWVREVIKLAQYVHGDSPAVGLMAVYWRMDKAVEMRRMSADDLLRYYLDMVSEQYGDGAEGMEAITAAQAAAEGFLMDLMDPAVPEDTFVSMIQQFFPSLSDSRARKVVKGIRTNDEAEFPVSIDRVSLPWVCSKRFMQDFWMANNTQDFQRARVWFESEWLSAAEVHERAALYGWNAQFVKEVLTFEGRAAFPDYEKSLAGSVVKYGPDRYRGLYQVLHAHFRAVNDDGVMGRYRMTFHADVSVSATGVELLDLPHGKYPGHFVQREVLNNRVLDSRSVAELVGPHQGLVKLFGDSAGDNAQLAGVPPVITRGRRNQGDLYIAPLVELQAKRDGDYSWMTPPPYPQTIFEMQKRLLAEIDEYHGRDTENVSPGLMNLHRQFKALWWLSNIGEVYKQLMSLCQEYMPPDVLARITNEDGDALMQSREDIAGEFDLQLLFDPMDMDPAYIKTLGEFIRDILVALDRDKQINMEPVVQSLFYRVAPAIADRAFKSKTRADADELKAEFDNYLKILGGVEPERVTDGTINYAVRAGMYDSIQQANPAAFASLSPDRQQILTAHVQHLQTMAEQYGANVDIGREGGRRALAQESAAVGV